MASRQEILAYGHALLATSGNYFGGQSFDIWILGAEAEDAGLPILEVVLRLFGIANPKISADPITCGQVRNTERTPAATFWDLLLRASRGLVAGFPQRQQHTAQQKR